MQYRALITKGTDRFIANKMINKSIHNEKSKVHIIRN